VGGFGEVLPVWEAVIFDEAYLVEEAATSYFGSFVSSGALAAALSRFGSDSRDFKPIHRH